MPNLTKVSLSRDFAYGTNPHKDWHTEIAQRLRGAARIAPPPPIGSNSSDATQFETWLASQDSGGIVTFGEADAATPTWLTDRPVKYRGDMIYEWPGQDDGPFWKVKDGVAMPTNSAVWVPQAWDNNSAVGENPVWFVNPKIDGNQANTTGNHACLMMGSMHWWKVIYPYLRNGRGSGLVLVNVCKNGTTYMGGDAADGEIVEPRLVANLEHGLYQRIGPSANAHMDVTVWGGRIFSNLKNAVMCNRPFGWTWYGGKLFDVRENGFETEDGWAGLKLNGLVIENSGYTQTTGTWSHLKLRGWGGRGFDVSGCDLWNNYDGGVEPTGPTFRYVYIILPNGAVNANGMFRHNMLQGGNRSGVVGIYIDKGDGAFNGSLALGGVGTNIVRNFATAKQTVGTGTLTESGSLFV